MKEFLSEENDPNQDLASARNDDESMVGRHIGPYRIEREIGRGGMGTVYEAWRADGEFRHRVAIKLIRRGLDTDFVLKRFRNERQILAALDHPNIGRLLAGGTTEEGSPYFVMEYIEGRPLYQYCDAQNLKVSERLRLFAQICDAVHYAHQKLVIHRTMAHLALGNHDEALDYLEKAAAERDPWLVCFGTEPKLDPLRADPRFVEIFRSTNNPLALK